MNTGLITFHCSYNFGSALQAYALQRAIEELGNQCLIVDYRSKNFDKYRLLKLRRPSRMFHDLRHYGRNAARKASFERFSDANLKLTDETFTYKDEAALDAISDRFDCFICGSDQIWNLDCTHGAVGPFFLSFAGDRRRVAYAPSLAHTSFRPENFDRAEVASLLSRFDYLSVREEETLPLFQPLVNKKIEVALDPTLLLGRNGYAAMASEEVAEPGYVFAYLLRECPELIESAAALAGRGGRRVVYVSEFDLPIPGSENLFGIGPAEFVSLVAHADAVLTNSFHATVFSVLFERDFLAFTTDKSGSRMRNLLGKLGLAGRCIDRAVPEMPEGPDWAAVGQRLDGLRRGSWDYLRKALS